MIQTSPASSHALPAVNPVPVSRVLAIDAFRGITMLVMIFVNTLAGVRGMPAWLEHMPPDVDGMTFVDVVFPAFLFIVGMSIPFALNQRRNDPLVRQQGHILQRAVGLLVLGVFMVNAEEGFNEAAMHMSIYLWSLLFYGCAILVWNVYRFSNPYIAPALRTAGIAGLIVLGWQFRGGPTGELHLAPQWWGILGLIGWAYLYSCIIYQLCRGKIAGLLTALVLCLAYYCLGHSGTNPDTFWFGQTENAAHTSIALAGLLCSVLYFEPSLQLDIRQRYLRATMLVAALVAAGVWLRPWFKISKNAATPTWCLYSAAICIVLFGLLYWIIDLKKWQGWTAFFKPAASNPLLIYLIPYIVYNLLQYLRIDLPPLLQQGLPGLAWSAGYAIAIMYLAVGLNHLKIRLQL